VLYGSSSYGFYSLEDTVQYVKNIIIQGCESVWAGSINSTTVLTNGTADFVDAANRDFRLNAESPGIDAGTDLSGDAVFPFDDDMYGTTRPKGDDWDIGLYEWDIPTATGSPIIFFFQ
jgi:hypothetical protein